MGQINSRNLTDILIVVVRYFGGVKLGTSGLIEAYRKAASDVIAAFWDAIVFLVLTMFMLILLVYLMRKQKRENEVI